MASRALILIVVVALSGGFARALEARRAESPGLPALESIPAELPGWRSREIPMSDGVQDALRADAWVFREYRSTDGAVVWFFIAYFSSQDVGSQIHSPRNCLPGSGWRIQEMGKSSVAVPGGEHGAFRLVLDRSGDRQEALYWFRTRGGTLTGEYALKWDLVGNSLRGRPTDAAFVRYMADREHVGAMRRLIAELHAATDAALAGVGLP